METLICYPKLNTHTTKERVEKVSSVASYFTATSNSHQELESLLLSLEERAEIKHLLSAAVDWFPLTLVFLRSRLIFSKGTTFEHDVWQLENNRRLAETTHQPASSSRAIDTKSPTSYYGRYSRWIQTNILRLGAPACTIKPILPRLQQTLNLPSAIILLIESYYGDHNSRHLVALTSPGLGAALHNELNHRMSPSYSIGSSLFGHGSLIFAPLKDYILSQEKDSVSARSSKARNAVNCPLLDIKLQLVSHHCPIHMDKNAAMFTVTHVLFSVESQPTWIEWKQCQKSNSKDSLVQRVLDLKTGLEIFVLSPCRFIVCKEGLHPRTSTVVIISSFSE